MMIDVTMTDRSVRPTRGESLQRLKSAQKSNRGAAGYSRWINRPAGRQIAAVAHVAGLTPNQISAISAAFTFAGIVVVATVEPSWYIDLVVAALLLAGYAFDSADGQVARLRGGGSAAGEWLDHVVDAAKIATFHLAVAISWFRFYEVRSGAWLLLPLGFAAVSSVFFFALVLSDMLRRVARLEAGGTGVTTSSVDPGEKAPVLRSLIVLPNDYGVLCLVMLALAWQTPFTVLYGLLFAANVLFLAAGLARWFREMSRLR